MRFVDGDSLAEIVRSSPLASRTAAEYIEATARGLEEAHQSGVLHRDIKPHNIMIDRKTDRALIADFGLAKLNDDGPSATMSGEVFGSPPYMSPEQAVDAASVTEATDIYGLGATLYHILTGRPPFQAASVPETLRQVLEQDPIAPREFNAGIDRDLETICLKCLKKERVRRYRTAGELADDLRRYLNDETILARRAGRLERVRKFTRRNTGLVIGTAAAVVALTLGLLGTATGMMSAISAKGLAETATSTAQAKQRELQGALTKLREEEARRAVAVLATYEQSGDLAAQRGRWRVALDSYAKALAGKPEDPTPLRIKRARMLIALFETKQAREEAAAILKDENASQHRADVLLMMGEAVATEFASADKGVSYYKEALETGQLKTADALFVKAVLAEDLGTAIVHAEGSLELEPFGEMRTTSSSCSTQ